MKRILFAAVIVGLVAGHVQAECADDHGEAATFASLVQHWNTRETIPLADPQKITTTVNSVLIDSNYDNGSLAGVTSGGANTFNCTLYNEPSIQSLGSKKYWFRFKMTGVAGRTITLNIDHSENPRPVISLDGGATWRRMTSVEAPNTSSCVLTFTAGQNAAEVAFFFPLGYQEIYDKIDAMIAAAPVGVATTEVIGTSTQGRDVKMVTITDPAFSLTGKRRVWIHARAHAGEVTASHTMLGWVEKMLENSDEGRRLRQYCVVTIVPSLNVDGIYLGKTRWDSQGMDPEREWCGITIPEVQAMKTKVDAFMASAQPIEVALNLHSTVGNFGDSFFFKHLSPSVSVAFETIQQNYINAFNAATPLFNNADPQSSQLSACIFIESYFWNNWGQNVMAMTHEGHYYRRVTDNDWITGADYQAIGNAQAKALIQYFSLPAATGVPDWAVLDE